MSVIPSPHTSLSRIFFLVGVGADSNSLPGADTEHVYMHMPGASTSAGGSDQADEGHIVGLLSPAARARDEETEVEELLREIESHHEPKVEVCQDPLLLSDSHCFVIHWLIYRTMAQMSKFKTLNIRL